MSNARIQFSTAEESVWNAYNPTLKEGEVAYVLKDNKKVKMVIGAIGGSAYKDSTVVWDEDNAQSLVNTATVGATNASASATSANASATAASASAGTASTKAANAANSATAAANSATAAASSATSASSYATTASNKATAAATSEDNAKNYASNAKTSESNAASYATTATSKATAADKSATAAAESATTASTYAGNASVSAGNASDSATAAAASATTASGYATTAINKATAADKSAINAAESATTASKNATAASTSASNAATSEDNAKTYAAAASTKASNAAASESNAKTYMDKAKEYSDNVNVFIPSVSTAGVLSWTNKAGLVNPTSVNIKGDKGDKGDKGTVDVDTALSTTSTNPVQNKVITAALNTKADTSTLATVATSGSYNDLSNKPTAIANTWTDWQHLQLASLSVERYVSTVYSGTTHTPATSDCTYTATGAFTLDLSTLAGSLSNSTTMVFSAQFKASADYALTIKNAGTLKYLGDASDIAITSAGLLLNIKLCKDVSGNLTSYVQGVSVGA